MNVLLVSHSASTGGAERCLLDLAVALMRRGAGVLVLCPEAGALTMALSEHGVPFFVIPMMRPQRSPLRIIELVARWGSTTLKLTQLMRERRITVVYNNTVDALYAPFAAVLARVPCVWHIHEVRPDPAWARRIMAGFIRMFASGAVFNSRSTLEAFAGSGKGPPNWLVVYNGIVPNESPLRERPSDGAIVVGFAADMRPHKRPELFLRAMALARAKVSGLRGIMAGDGLLLETARRTATSLGLEECVTFRGRVADMSVFYAEIDLLVLTSEREGFGLVLVEAMAAARAVVAAGVGGVPEIVEDGISGYIVPPDDVSAYARCIVALATGADLRRRMGAAGRERVLTRFSVARYCDEMVGLLEGVSARR